MLYGKNVRLRAIERENIPNFVRWFNDPEVRRFIQMNEPMSKAAEERWFEERLGKKGDYIFGIEALIGEDWVAIGNLGLHQIDWKNRCAIFGIILGEKAYWGKGFGTEAARTVLRFAFDELNLHRVELDVYSFNPRAIRCYEKVGFRREGTRREALFREGKYQDVHTMAILQPEFAAQGSLAAQ